MPGFDDPWLPPDGGRVLDAIPVGVYRIGEFGDLEYLPNVEAVDVEWPDGGRPRTCRLAYKFDGLSPETDPQWAEEALSSAGELSRVIRPNDRIGVLATEPDGSNFWMFDGHPYGFEAILDDGVEEVVLACAGVEKTLWDTPVPGMLLRNANEPYDEKLGDDPNHVPTDLPAVFNAGGKPNRTPKDTEYDPDGNADRVYHVFLDPELVQDPDPRAHWTLADAAAYLIYASNPGETFVESPDSDTLAETLVRRKPHPDYDPYDSTTWDKEDIRVPETPITGRPWPAVLEALIADKGFALDFRLDSPADDQPPRTRLDVYFQQAAPVQDLWLQDHDGTPVDVQLSNVGSCHLARDISEAPNRWEVLGRRRLEITAVLACGFPSSSTDGASESAIKAFDADAMTTPNRDKFRLYIFDECGEGHYQPASTTKETDVASLDDALGSTADNDGVPTYAKHRRPAVGDLISAEADGRPIRARLAYSTDYAGPSPGLWDGTGTWHTIQGGYDILPDRLGIWVNVQNPNNWQIGHQDGAEQVLKGVEAQSKDAPPNPKFYLRLTCVVEEDRAMKAIAERRDRAPLSRDVTRVVDGRDRYRLERKSPKSEFNTGTDFYATRDDTDAARAEAESLRDATDAGVLDGPVTIPWLTMHYDRGDLIRGINGRELGFRTDGGDDATWPTLPSVRSIRWTLRGDQQTHLHISDGQAMRRSYRRKIAGSAAMRPRGGK